MGMAPVFGSRSAVVLLAAAWCLPAAGQAVSFSREVAPILAAKCGGCHVGGRKGNFHMPSYAALMQTGVVQRGAGNSSRLVEVILSGDMPRGSGKVSSDEVGVLMKWIDGGAPFDGPDPTMALDAVARGGAAAPKPAAVAVPAGPVALKPGDVSFSFDVVPVLIKQCAGCHGTDDPEARLSMASLESMLRGGRSGAPIVPGRSGESLLVRKIRGRDIEGQRMPLGREPLGDPVIAMIAKWIDQGARLDLLTARTPLEIVAAAGRARSMSDDELAKIRFAAAPKVWRRAIPDESPVVEERGPLCVVGNLPEARMEELSKAASSLEERARRDVVADGQPLLKGGVVLFVFRQSYDYSALWQSLVGGERPKGVTGNAGVSGDVAYGAMIVPANDPDGENTRLLLAEQLVAAASAGRGLPAWFSRGVGRAVAARVVPKAPLAQEWRKEVPAALQKIGSTADFFDGHADAGAMAVAGGGFVGALASTGGRLRSFFKFVDEGLAFDDAFTKTFRATPQQAFETWAVKESRKPSR